MKKNIGSADRIIRVVAAAIFVALSLTGMVSGGVAIVFSLAALVFATTSFIGHCPLYRAFGISTARPGAQNEA